MSALYKFRVYCKTTNSWEHVWSAVAPTACPKNNTHEIDATSVTVTETRRSHEVVINDVNPATMGYFMCEGKLFDIPATATTTLTFSYPFPIAVHRAHVYPSAQNSGDVLSVIVAPNTIVGVTTASLQNGATTIPVSDSVLGILVRGFHVAIGDGNNIANMGRIITVDLENRTIHVEFATTRTYSAGAFIMMNRCVVKDVTLSSVEKVAIGGGMVGGSVVPANTTIAIPYKNNSGQSKTLNIVLEYTY